MGAREGNSAGNGSRATHCLRHDSVVSCGAPPIRHAATQVLNTLTRVRETPTGFLLQITRPASIAAIAEWMEIEHRCCAFLDIDLSLRADGTTWIQIGGSAAIKEFLKEEFSAFRGVGLDGR
jgi:hypothetical protein